LSNRRFLILVALLLLGIGFSLVFGRLGHPFASTAFRAPRIPLDRFPLVIGSWTGEDEPLPDRVRDIAGMDLHLNRKYISESGESVHLYLAYYGNRQRGMRTIYHNPTVCLDAAGWTQVGRQKVRVRTDSDEVEELRATLYTFRRMGRSTQILSFYLVDDELLDGPPREKPLRLALEKLKLSFDPGYYVQVQVVPEADRDPEAARRAALTFLRLAAPHILRHF
jgi:EpsI family protein